MIYQRGGEGATVDEFKTQVKENELSPVFGDSYEICTNMAQLSAPPMPEGLEATLKLEVSRWRGEGRINMIMKGDDEPVGRRVSGDPS